MKISGYDIIKKIGEGSSAVVWKAHQVSLDRVVAIKILKAHLSSDPAEVRDFISEARAAAQLKHPNLIQVFDVSNKGQQYYFVMEYIDGPSINGLLNQLGTISQKNALKIIRNVVEALKCAWEQANLIHRDIKPDNIMIDSDGTTKLADLGLAKRVDPARAAQRAAAGYIAGTPNYMSPEQAAGSAKLDSKTDMYCLGATLYHMVVGQMPFAGDSTADALNKQITGYIPNPRTINANVSPATERLITRLMMKSPSDRHENWDAVLEDIKMANSGKASAGDPAPVGRSTISPMNVGSSRPGVAPIAVAPIAVAPAPVSTVPPTDRFTPVPMPVPVVQSPPVAAFPSAKRAAKPKPTPPIVKFVAWTILITWWGALAWLLFGKPEIISKYLPASEPSYLPDAVQPEKASTAKEQSEVEIEADTDADPLADTLTDNADSVAQKPVQTTPADNELLPDLKGKLVDLLTALDFRGALSALEQEKKARRDDAELKEIEELRAFIAEVSTMDSVIQSSFAEKTGEDVVINYKNRRLQVALKAVSGNNISFSLLVKAAGGGTELKSITIPLSSLGPHERARWIGPANTQPRCAMKYLLLTKAGDAAAASAYAPNCGPLSSAFAERLKHRAPE